MEHFHTGFAPLHAVCVVEFPAASATVDAAAFAQACKNVMQTLARLPLAFRFFFVDANGMWCCV